LIQDVRDIIETARSMMREMEADKLFWNLVRNTRDIDISQAKKNPS
jgi:hypothetical protein